MYTQHSSMEVGYRVVWKERRYGMDWVVESICITRSLLEFQAKSEDTSMLVVWWALQNIVDILVTRTTKIVIFALWPHLVLVHFGNTLIFFIHYSITFLCCEFVRLACVCAFCFQLRCACRTVFGRVSTWWFVGVNGWTCQFGTRAGIRFRFPCLARVWVFRTI